MDVTITATQEELQKYFDINIEDLKELEEDDIKYLKQSHFGDLLIEESNEDGERYKLWRNLDSNGAEIEIEYCGKLNNYVYQTVLTLNTNF
jgi:ethanolamine utilization cobalamin adenosyltransferase